MTTTDGTRGVVPAVLATLLLICASSAGFADSPPAAPNGVLELEGHTGVIGQLGSFDLLADLTGRLETAALAFDYRALTLGAYYRPLKNLKVGAFYRLQAGVRHDDDWISPPGTAPWAWQDTAGRFENELMLDVSPRFLLDFLPGRSWVFLLKARYVYNTFENQQSIMARPELTFFWLVDRQPFMDFFAAWEAWFPLNFGTTTIYESYPWIGVHYHVTPEVMLELGGAYKTTVWSTSQEWTALAVPNTPYQVSYSRWLLSFGVIYLINP